MALRPTIAALALLVASYLDVSAQAIPAATVTLRVPEHRWDPWKSHLVAIDPFKFIGFAHLFYLQGLGDHLAIGGALQVPTGVLRTASGIGAQPEITFALGRDPFEGLYIGATAWVNHLTYFRDSVGRDGRVVETPELQLSELIVSAGPVFGAYMESPINGAISQVAVGAEYVLKPGTENAAGMGTDVEGFRIYFTARLGLRW